MIKLPQVLVSPWSELDYEKLCWFSQKQPNLARYGRISKRSQLILKRSRQIWIRSGWISMRFRQVLTDRIKNTDKSLLSMEDGDFPMCRQLGRLKISFSCLDPPTNPLPPSFASSRPILDLDRTWWASGLGHEFGWTPLYMRLKLWLN